MPARVTIKPTVWADSRFQVLAALLGCNHYEAIGRMAAIWGECTDQETDRLEPAFLAVHLGCDPDQAGQLLQRAKLGEIIQPAASHMAGECLVRIRGCVGMTEWLAEKRAAALKGGKARAAKAKRGVTGSFQPENQPAASHMAGECLDECLASSPASSQPESSPPAPAPAPAPASSLCEPFAGARKAHPPPGQAPGGRQGNRKPERRTPQEPPTPSDSELMAGDKPMGIGPDRERAARLLWELQEQARRRVVPDCPPLALGEVPGSRLDAVRLALSQYAPATLCRALDVAEAEAECLAAAGDDPLRYLNGVSNWRPQCLAHNVATTPELVRRRHVGTPAPPAGRTARSTSEEVRAATEAELERRRQARKVARL